MEFLIGCNYWASRGGIRMWQEWDEAETERDLQALAGQGVRCIRVFPLWSDFQPLIPMYEYQAGLREYRMADEAEPENPYGLAPVMLARFERFCELAGKHGMRLIVGLLTGWMSGRCYLPPALYGKALYTDPEALLLEQKFAAGMVSRFRHRPEILAWDLGNECNCLNPEPSRAAAENWTMLIADAIRANDPERPVVSGMHTLSESGVWRICDQAAHTDLLTTHPYPFFVEYAAKDALLSFRTMQHAVCETKYYADLGGRPCLVEEIGTLGPGKCSEETAAAFLRVNLYSNWVHGAQGVLWWCANDMTHRTDAPYSWNMYERELGLLRHDRSPKPAAEELRRFSRWLSQADLTLPPAQTDGVCITTRGQSQWGTAYMSHLLAAQAKANIRFCGAEQTLPEANVYLLPSIEGDCAMTLARQRELAARVFAGAQLYISTETGVLADMEALTGMRIEDSSEEGQSGSFLLDGAEIPYRRTRTRRLTPLTAQVLAADERGQPVLSVNRYGRGCVWLLSFCMEAAMLEESEACAVPRYQIYGRVFAQALARKPLLCQEPFLGVTIHPGQTETYAAVINYSAAACRPAYCFRVPRASIETVFGNAEELAPAGMTLFRWKNAAENKENTDD